MIPTERTFSKTDWVVFLVLSTVCIAAIFVFFSQWFQLPGWFEHPILLSLVTFILVAQLCIQQVPWWLLPRMRRPIPPDLPRGARVGAFVTVVPAVEPIEMLEATLREMVAMDYSHETWVLDEGDDDAVRALCASLGAHHFTRKGRAEYQTESGPFKARTKYGNVNAWLEEIGYERFDFVTGFDPDHAPKPEFLERVLPYFEDPKVGYVQAAQVYYNQSASFIARGAAEETYAYYSSLQMSSMALGYPVVTGCHNTHRATALREVGGFAAHDADDLLITLHYLSAGWRGVYVPEVLAKGITPVDWDGYLEQQHRWARSVIDIKLRKFPRLANKLPWRTRAMSFLHGLAYVQESLQAPISIGIVAYVLATGRVPLLSYLVTPAFLTLLGILGVSELYRQRFFLEGRREWGLHWRARIVRLAKWPHVLMAMFEVICNRRVPYSITRKTPKLGGRRWILWAHLILAGVVLLALGVGAARSVPVEGWLRVAGIVIAAGSLGVFFSQRLSFPAPYDRSLQMASRSDRL